MNNKLAFVFPGQGSQSVGMLSGLAEKFPVVSEVFFKASEVLGYDLLSLCENGPEEKLNLTENTQPALLAASYAVWRIWREQKGGTPQVVAGHSLGEYSALVCAGVLEFSDAVGLVRDRGLYMQEAVPEGQGAMAAILGLDDEKIMEVCNRASPSEDVGGRKCKAPVILSEAKNLGRGQIVSPAEIVSPANFNSPGQVVIAGHANAVERAIALAKEAGAKRAILLPVSVPSHCRLMGPAAEKLAERFREIRFHSAAIPVIQNVDAQPRSDSREIREALLSQLQEPVLWSKTISAMARSGVSKILECGPGKVLSGLCRRIDRGIAAAGLSDSDAITAALQASHDP